MTDTEMILQAIEGFKNDVQEQFKKVDSRFDMIEERLNIIEEEAEITRNASNISLDILKELTEELIRRGLYTPTDKKVI